MENTISKYMDGLRRETHQKELQKQIAKTLSTRTDKINVLSVITDENGASLVKFTWTRNCDTYLAVIAKYGKIQLYREVSQ